MSKLTPKSSMDQSISCVPSCVPSVAARRLRRLASPSNRLVASLVEECDQRSSAVASEQRSSERILFTPAAQSSSLKKDDLQAIDNLKGKPRCTMQN